MLKINDKVRVLRLNDAGHITEVGKGIVRQVFSPKSENSPNFISFTDKDWKNQDITEVLPVNSVKMKVVKV
jgi:hypothetical protein